MKIEGGSDIVVLILIFFAGLLSAWVCFGVLSSTASGEFQSYSVGGAIAGAVVSWAILTSVFLQLRGSSTELRELRQHAEELQRKVIRGAPRPPGFDTELDERQRIVLARPKEWQPKYGTIFQFEEKVDLEVKKDDADVFPATFQCTFYPIEEDTEGSEEGAKQAKESEKTRREKFYEGELGRLKEQSQFILSSTYEMVRLGAEASEIECLKVIAQQCARIRIGPMRETGRMGITWTIINREQFTGWILEAWPRVVHTGPGQKLTLKGYSFRDGMVAYVNNEKRETQVMWPKPIPGQGQIFESEFAEVTLKASDVARACVLEIQVENKDTRGLRSNTFGVSVVERPEGEAARPAIQEGGSGAAESGANSANQEAEENGKPGVGGKTAPKERFVWEQIIRMRVVCYHDALGKIFYFDFLDDLKDFKESSAVFNRILASTRFLD